MSSNAIFSGLCLLAGIVMLNWEKWGPAIKAKLGTLNIGGMVATTSPGSGPSVAEFNAVNVLTAYYEKTGNAAGLSHARAAGAELFNTQKKDGAA